MDSGIPVSVWRYYLISNRPETSDSVFTWDDFATRTNSELLANLGNFVNRTLKFLKAKYQSVVPEYNLEDKETKDLIPAVNQQLVLYGQNLEAVKLRAGLKCAMDISGMGNAYLQDNKLDNNLFEQNPIRCQTVMVVAVNLIYLLSALLYPYIPSSSEEMCKQLNAPMRMIPDQFGIDILPGHGLGSPDHLFKRIDEKKMDQLRQKYGGQ
jgi:methionyl-tRNA synthetase